MKKLFTLVSAVLMAASMSAVVTLDPTTQTPVASGEGGTASPVSFTDQGIEVSYSGTLNEATQFTEADFRIFGGCSLTLEADSSISKVVIIGKAKKNFNMEVSSGKITTMTTSSSADMEKKDWSDPLIVVEKINAKSFTMDCVKQLRAYAIQVYFGTDTTGGDTTAIEDVNGMEIDFYPSYSEEGAYNYSIILYNSEDDDYLPQVVFDIYTATEKAFAGTYTMQDGSMSEYSYYLYGTGDEDYAYMDDGAITIVENGENMTIVGWFEADGEFYTVNMTAAYDYYNAEYPYEPETPEILNLTITDGEEDNTYAEYYGVIDIYLTTADGDLQLEYIMLSSDTYTSIPDGTYPIETTEYDEEGYSIEKAYNYFDAGYYYVSYGMAAGSYYGTEDANYYLVDGSVTILTTQAGKKVTLAGTTYYGSTINAEYTISSTPVENVEAETVAAKRIKNGNLQILRNGVHYNAVGAVVE